MKLQIFNAHFLVTCRRLICSVCVCIVESYIIASKKIYGEICSEILLNECNNNNGHGQYVLDWQQLMRCVTKDL